MSFLQKLIEYFFPSIFSIIAFFSCVQFHGSLKQQPPKIVWLYVCQTQIINFAQLSRLCSELVFYMKFYVSLLFSPDFHFFLHKESENNFLYFFYVFVQLYKKSQQSFFSFKKGRGFDKNYYCFNFAFLKSIVVNVLIAGVFVNVMGHLQEKMQR